VAVAGWNKSCTLKNGAFASCQAVQYSAYAFGQPTNRTQSIFGSAGRRAIQVGGRITF
jgi:hypothetical protein